jgi:hypothetical protein
LVTSAVSIVVSNEMFLALTEYVDLYQLE